MQCIFILSDQRVLVELSIHFCML